MPPGAALDLVTAGDVVPAAHDIAVSIDTNGRPGLVGFRGRNYQLVSDFATVLVEGLCVNSSAPGARVGPRNEVMSRSKGDRWGVGARRPDFHGLGNLWMSTDDRNVEPGALGLIGTNPGNRKLVAVAGDRGELRRSRSNREGLTNVALLADVSSIQPRLRPPIVPDHEVAALRCHRRRSNLVLVAIGNHHRLRIERCAVDIQPQSEDIPMIDVVTHPGNQRLTITARNGRPRVGRRRLNLRGCWLGGLVQSPAVGVKSAPRHTTKDTNDAHPVLHDEQIGNAFGT